MSARRTSSSGHVPARRRPARLVGAVVLALLLALAAVSILALQPPPPEPADAPAGEFSAARAFRHVERIAAETHVAGSPAGDRVVEYLDTTLDGLGLGTRVQNTVGSSYAPGQSSTEMARVRNVVAVLPGTDPTGRIFLVAHHDSIQVGPGAGDDASGVATLLETVRALTAGEPLRNDVVVVLTDAEEACICGAEAFVARHPLAAEGGVVLNVEARGTTGPPVMFETSPGNAGLVGAYAAAAPHPVASSLAAEVYRALPRDTDFSAFLAGEGFTGLNSAFIDGAAANHTAQDTPDRLDRSSLQAHGDNTLALTRDLGGRELGPLTRPAAADATYFPLFGQLISYPVSWIWPLAGAAVGAVVLLALVARAVGESSFGRTLGGTVLAVLPLVLAPGAVHGAWALLTVVRPEYAGMADPWRPEVFRLAAVALVATVVLLWFAALRRALGAAALITGALVWPAVLGAVLAVQAPGGSYLGAVPALAGAVTGIAWVITNSLVLRALAAVVGGAVAVLVLAPTVSLIFPALGLAAGAAPALLTTLLVLALLPAFDLLFPEGGERRWVATSLVPVTAGALTVALAAAAVLVDSSGARHPAPSHLMYALDADSGQAWWASLEPPSASTAAYLRGDGPALPNLPFVGGGEVWSGTAEVADLAPPVVEVVADVPSGGARQVTVRVTSARPDVRLVTLDLSTGGGTIRDARVGGRTVTGDPLGGGFLRVTFHAPPDDGLEATFTVEGGDGLDLRVTDGSDGLTGLPGFQPRPEGLTAAGSHSSDVVLVSATTSLG